MGKDFHTALAMWIILMRIDMPSARMADQWLCVVIDVLDDLTTKAGGELVKYACLVIVSVFGFLCLSISTSFYEAPPGT